MYKILITEELKSEIYNEFIDYAFSKSDAFMVVVYKYSERLDEMFKLPNKKLFKKESLYLRVVSSIQKSKEEKRKDIAIFKKYTEPFIKKINPYLIKKRNTPTVWPGTMTILNQYMGVDICVYKISDEVKCFINEPNGLFNWKYPYYPDDLCFFKEGYCWFNTVAHEGYACMFVENFEEIEKLKELGLMFNVSEDNINEKDLFYEDYNL